MIYEKTYSGVAAVQGSACRTCWALATLALNNAGNQVVIHIHIYDTMDTYPPSNASTSFCAFLIITRGDVLQDEFATRHGGDGAKKGKAIQWRGFPRRPVPVIL